MAVSDAAEADEFAAYYKDLIRDSKLQSDGEFPDPADLDLDALLKLYVSYDVPVHTMKAYLFNSNEYTDGKTSAKAIRKVSFWTQMILDEIRRKKTAWANARDLTITTRIDELERVNPGMPRKALMSKMKEALSNEHPGFHWPYASDRELENLKFFYSVQKAKTAFLPNAPRWRTQDALAFALM